MIVGCLTRKSVVGVGPRTYLDSHLELGFGLAGGFLLGRFEFVSGMCVGFFVLLVVIGRKEKIQHKKLMTGDPKLGSGGLGWISGSRLLRCVDMFCFCLVYYFGWR